MLRLKKYIAPFLLSIALIIGLLYVQAQSDLALPEYMSQIVDNGVSNNGIEHVSPDALRVSTYDKLMLFLEEEEQKLLSSHYTLSSASEAGFDTYPLLASENLYVRNTVSKEELKQLNELFTRPLLIVSNIDMMMADSSIPTNSLFASLPAGANPYDVIAAMPAVKRAELQTSVLEVFSAMPESTMQAAAKVALKREYEASGMDMTRYQQSYILSIGLLMLGIALIGSIASITVSFLASRVAAGMSRNLRKAVFEKVTYFSHTEFHSFSTASLITRTTNDIQQIQQILVMLLRMVAYAPLVGIGALLKVLNTNVSMSWVIGLAVAVILIIIITAFTVAFPRFKRIQLLVDRLNQVMREFLSGMLVIRAFNTQSHEEVKFERANKDITENNLFVNRIMSILMPAMMFVMNSVSLLVVWVGSQQIDMGTLQVGEMMAFLQYAMQIIMSFLMISMISIMLPRAQVAANRIADVLAIEPSITDPEVPYLLTNAESNASSKNHDIVFDHVSFRYPGAEENILHDISFTAKPGEVTAFIGSTGSGKSTLINLLPRFFDVTEGSLSIHGVDVRSYAQHDLRDMIGFVPQKGVLFSGTMASNLRYGKEDASLEDMTQAAAVAQAMEFISQKDLGFEEPIAQGGTNVSGGQKQRLSIARALIKKAGIYIFDDTFSALDYKTEAMLRRSLEKMMKSTNSTIFIVAQRINTIMNADQIIVLDRGRIVGKGSHDELIETCTVYQEIAYSQLSKEELAHE